MLSPPCQHVTSQLFILRLLICVVEGYGRGLRPAAAALHHAFHLPAKITGCLRVEAFILPSLPDVLFFTLLVLIEKLGGFIEP